MKVLFTVPWGERLGGAEAMLHAYVLQSRPGDVQPTVAFVRDGEWRQELDRHGVATEVLGGRRLRDARAASLATINLARTLRRRRPDILVNWSATTQLYGAAARALSGLDCRVVWWQHAIPRPHWLDRLATRAPADAIGCSSRAAASRQQEITPRRDVFVVHPGVVLPPASAPPVRPNDPSVDVVVGLVARLQPWKGQDRLVRALARLRQRGVAVRGILVGGDAWGLSPGYAQELSHLVSQLELDGTVTLTGQVDDPWPWLREMDILVSASDEEPFGIAIVEAMAAGLPVVAPAAGGPAEIVEHERTGLLVRDASSEALASGIERLALDPELRRRMGAAARQHYDSRFTVGKMERALTAALERIAAR